MSRPLESPFLDDELFTRESTPDWEPRASALVAQSPFLDALAPADLAANLQDDVGGGPDEESYEYREEIEQESDEGYGFRLELDEQGDDEQAATADDQEMEDEFGSFEGFAPKVSAATLRTRIDDYFNLVNTEYTLTDGTKVKARSQFRYAKSGGIDQAKTRLAKTLGSSFEKKHPLAIHYAVYGRPKPAQIAAITQALIDAGQFDALRKKYSTLTDRQLIRRMQREFGIGIDCAGYVQLAFIYAFTASDDDPKKTRLNLGLQERRGNERLSDLPSSHFKKLASITDAETGDLLVLRPRDGDIDRAWHTVMIVERTSSGTEHTFLGDASWGTDLYGENAGGIGRRQLVHDTATGEWWDIHPLTGAEAHRNTIGPYAKHHLHGVFRARQSAKAAKPTPELESPFLNEGVLLAPPPAQPESPESVEDLEDYRGVFETEGAQNLDEALHEADQEGKQEIDQEGGPTEHQGDEADTEVEDTEKEPGDNEEEVDPPLPTQPTSIQTGPVTKPSYSTENPWGEPTAERWSYEGAVEGEGEGEESEYPNARIIPEIGEASYDSEETEEKWTEQLASPTPGPAVRARILWPALGFPAVIAPREKKARGNLAGDATRCISLLVLANRTLTRDDVARHLRCVTWDNRWQRHIPEGTSASTFRAAEIAVRADVKTDPISLSTPKNRLISLVGFGGGKGEKSAIIGGIAKAVLDFYTKQLPKDKRLPYLHEIRISEDASNGLADGQYHLFWNNAAQAQDVPSDEMRLVIDYHAHPLRERTVESYEEHGKYLLEEYEFEYGILHQPYQQSYSQLTMRRPRAEVLHPLFVKREQNEPLRIGHLTDLHVDVRADVYEANLEAAMKFVPKPDYLALFNKAWETLRQRLVVKKRSPSPWRTKADLEELARLSGLPKELVLSIAATQRLTKYWRKGSYNNLNRSFRENYTKAKAESDILLLTGDLIDYGRGHYGVKMRGKLGENWLYHEDRNWFLFYWLLAGDKSYTLPSYTILGNHDWRVNPYPPFAIAGAPAVESILNNHEGMIPEFRKWLLQIAHGSGHERAFSYVSTAIGTLDLVEKDPAAALSAAGRLAANTGRLNIKGAPTETTVASVMWYLLTINPFLDYSFSHPSGQKLLMLDWAEAEDVLFDIVERGKARPYLPHEAARASDPGPKAGDCLTAAQQKMVVNFLARPGVSKLVGIHAPPIAPWYDWFDSELVKSRKVFPSSTVTNRRRELGSFQTPEDCEKGEGKWDEDAGKCVEKGVPRGPDVVSTLATGEKKKWNGHPFFAIRPPNAFHGMVADYGSLVKGRDWFITQLIEPKYGVRAVFSGHNHRDGLHTLWRMGPQSGAQTNGTVRVRLLAGRVRSVKPGSILGPLWVNTTSAGFRGHYRPSSGQDHYVPPGRALVSVRRDGTIDVAEFRRLPGIDKRAMAVPAAVSPHSTPVAAE